MPKSLPPSQTTLEQNMGTRKYLSGQQETKPETERLLTAAEYFLGNRNFEDCRNYALRARDTDPTHPAPARLLSIAFILSAPNISPTRPDYYAVLSLPRFESYAARIRSSFKNLTSILNPNINPHPLSSEAYDSVLKAWSVLSNPLEKVRFDEELRRVLGGTSRSEGSTFWTMCPYCYNVYEYEKIFCECCLRCANERCRRGFHAVALPVPPPPEVVQKGVYLCQGFSPYDGREENGENSWIPFAPRVGASGGGGDCDGGRNQMEFFEGEDDVMVGLQKA